MPLNLSVRGVKCIKFLFLVSIYHKKEIKVNNLTPVYFQNFIYPLAVFKCDLIEPTCFKKPELA